MPGPGNYAQDGLAHVKSAPKFGFGKSKRDSSVKRQNEPGPGNYSARNLLGEEMPKYSIGKTNNYNHAKKEQKSKPGPGNYSPETKGTKRKEPSYKIGTGTRRDHAAEKA